MENIKEKVEAILFATGRVITREEILDIIDVSNEELEKAIEDLKNKYNQKASGIVLLEVAGGIELVSNKKCFDDVIKFVETSKKQNLSPTCMEVLSIVAYNKNITKSETEKIRGVNSDSQVSRLLEYGLIEETARLNLPGRPATFATTNEFLKCMGIKELSELPEFNEIGEEKKLDLNNIVGQEKIEL